MALTSDFTGTYDYEREEAASVAESFIEGIESEFYRNADEYQQAVIKERAHWSKFADFDMAGFADEFNKRTVPVCLRAYGREIYM